MAMEIVVYDGFDDLDGMGPLEVLHGAGFEVSLVTADGAAQVVSASGARIGTSGRLGEAPDLLVVPGGGWGDRSPSGAWAEARRGLIPNAIAERAKRGTTVAAVCTGAMLVAAAGLLKGRPATTHHSALQDLRAAGARVLEGFRVVDDGSVLTAGGVTSGLDLAIWLVERMRGAEAARMQELRIEYQRGAVWQRPRVEEGARPDPAAADREARQRLESRLPSTPIARAALRRVESVEAPFLFNHSVRSFLFAEVAARELRLEPERDYDAELLFLSCLLHDIGLVPGTGARPRFEVDGADAAVALLDDLGLQRQRAETVWEAIALHTSAGIAERRRPEVALTRAGITTDFGRAADTVPVDLATTIHAAYPRLDMARALTDAVVAQAGCCAAAAPAYSLPGELLRERSVAPFSTRMEREARSGPWGS